MSITYEELIKKGRAKAFAKGYGIYFSGKWLDRGNKKGDRR